MDSTLTCTGEMAEPLSLIDCLPVTKKDHLELEIAERLSKEHKETVDGEDLGIYQDQLDNS